MEDRKLTKNSETGRPHTGKWPTILSLSGAIIILMLALFAEKWTGVGLEQAWPVVLFLCGIAGVGGVSMARRG